MAQQTTVTTYTLGSNSSGPYKGRVTQEGVVVHTTIACSSRGMAKAEALRWVARKEAAAQVTRYCLEVQEAKARIMKRATSLAGIAGLIKEVGPLVAEVPGNLKADAAATILAKREVNARWQAAGQALPH